MKQLFLSDAKGRNRDETRIATVFDASDKITDTEWRPHIKTIIQVNRRVLTHSAATGVWRRSTETAFYVSDTTLGAAQTAKALRAHWHIENTSHYSRDVTFGEDRCRIRTNPAVFARCVVSPSTSSRPTRRALPVRIVTARWYRQPPKLVAIPEQ